MKLDLTAGEEAVRELSLETPPEEIELVPPRGFEARFERDIAVRISVRRVGEEFFIRGEARTEAVYTCVRCLSEYRSTSACLKRWNIRGAPYDAFHINCGPTSIRLACSTCRSNSRSHRPPPFSVPMDIGRTGTRIPSCRSGLHH